MEYALCLSVYVALLVAAVVRAARPDELLAGTVGVAWQGWLIFRPRWLPDKATGSCAYCTAFWMLGLPVGIAAAFGPAGWWALGIPFLIAILTEKLL